MWDHSVTQVISMNQQSHAPPTVERPQHVTLGNPRCNKNHTHYAWINHYKAVAGTAINSQTQPTNRPSQNFEAGQLGSTGTRCVIAQCARTPRQHMLYICLHDETPTACAFQRQLQQKRLASKTANCRVRIGINWFLVPAGGSALTRPAGTLAMRCINVQ